MNNLHDESDANGILERLGEIVHLLIFDNLKKKGIKKTHPLLKVKNIIPTYMEIRKATILDVEKLKK